MKNSDTQTMLIAGAILTFLVSAFGGFSAGLMATGALDTPAWMNWTAQHVFQLSTDGATNKNDSTNIIQVQEQSAVIDVANDVSPAVVSIIVTKDIPKLQQPLPDFFGFPFQQQPQQNGTERREVGGGTGFIVSEDGYVVTNKHVVIDESADYSVLLNDERQLDARVLARDPVNDIAILKVDSDATLPTVALGNSDDIQIGQTAIAIGNALGEFRNTVSAGIISGLSRSLTASGIGIGSERLTNAIQTDAAINPGNSGGPLLNIAGQVIGMNTAVAGGAQSIGFAIPINDVKTALEKVRTHGEIVRPWLGVRYIPVTDALAQANQLPVDHGALVLRGQQATDLAVVPGSPADKAGIQENDIILSVNDEQINEDNPLANMLAQYTPGDTVTLEILHKGDRKTVEVTLGTFN